MAFHAQHVLRPVQGDVEGFRAQAADRKRCYSYNLKRHGVRSPQGCGGQHGDFVTQFKLKVVSQDGSDKQLILPLLGKPSFTHQGRKVNEGCFSCKIDADAECTVVFPIEIKICREVDSAGRRFNTFDGFCKRQHSIHIKAEMQRVVPLILLERLVPDSYLAGIVGGQVCLHIRFHAFKQCEQRHDGHGRYRNGDCRE